MKKQLLLLVMMLLPMVVSADSVEIDGIWYNLVPKAMQAEVTSNPNSQIKYYGNVKISASVNYEGTEYSVTSIGARAFRSCGGLTSVTIPNSVISIGENAFEYCVGLTSIIIPNSVISIGSQAFQNCSGLTSVTIPNSVTSIESYVFHKCLGLTSMTIPNSVMSIGNFAFQDCTGLTSITIPNSVTSIGIEAFSGCCGLTSVTIPSSVTSIEQSSFRGCSDLKYVTIPNSITSIGTAAFEYCAGLTSVSIPNSVKDIESYAFRNCSNLAAVTIGSGVDYISFNVFANCLELADVYCYAENVPSASGNVFDGSLIEYATLHVPAASLNAYKATSPWSEFGTFKTLEGEEVQKCAMPTISYNKGELIFSSETEGAEYVSEITDTDIKKHYDATISLTATYNISVYAKKTGYDNSDIATATLCWIDKDPTTEGITDGVAQIPSNAVLIQNEGGTLIIQGADDGTQISIYDIDGAKKGAAIIKNGTATINTSLQSGSVAIIKIGEKSVKIIVK